MRVCAIVCEVLYRELCHCAARSKNVVDLLFVSQGLHDIGPDKMSAALQEKIDAVDSKRYQAVVMGYALCNNGIVGLRARHVPLIVPRAHDCITLFFGSHAKYLEYFNAHPGTYYMTTGWLERDKENLEDHAGGVMGQLGIFRTYREYVEKYGEENAKYIMETLGDWRRNYSRMTHIDMGFCDESAVAAHARDEAAKNGWQYDAVPGDLSLIQRLLDGDWPARDFLVVQPGQTVRVTNDDTIIAAE